MKKNIWGVAEKIKICERGPQNFPFHPPQDLKLNSPKGQLINYGLGESSNWKGGTEIFWVLTWVEPILLGMLIEGTDFFCY